MADMVAKWLAIAWLNDFVSRVRYSPADVTAPITGPPSLAEGRGCRIAFYHAPCSMLHATASCLILNASNC